MQSEESGILDLDNCDLWEVVCGRQKPVLKAKSGSEEKKKKPAKRSKDDDEEEEQKPAKRSKKEKEKEKEKKHESKRSTKPLVEKKKKSKKVAVEATADKLVELGVSFQKQALSPAQSAGLVQALEGYKYWRAPLERYKTGARLLRAKIIFGKKKSHPHDPTQTGYGFYGFPHMETPDKCPKFGEHIFDHEDAPARLKEVWTQLAPWADQAMVTVYNDGDASIPLHSDKVHHLDRDADIVDVIVGQGATRPFQIEEVATGNLYEIKPVSGSCITLTPRGNQLVKHGVDKTKGFKFKKRYSIVFRKCKSIWDPATASFVYDSSTDL